MATDSEIIKSFDKFISEEQTDGNSYVVAAGRAAIRLWRMAFDEGRADVLTDKNREKKLSEMLAEARASERAKWFSSDEWKKELDAARADERKKWEQSQAKRILDKAPSAGEVIGKLLTKEIADAIRADEREKCEDVFKAVFDKIEEHRKAHRKESPGGCNCPACNPTIASIYVEFINKLEASESAESGEAFEMVPAANSGCKDIGMARFQGNAKARQNRELDKDN